MLRYFHDSRITTFCLSNPKYHSEYVLLFSPLRHEEGTMVSAVNIRAMRATPAQIQRYGSQFGSSAGGGRDSAKREEEPDQYS